LTNTNFANNSNQPGRKPLLFMPKKRHNFMLSDEAFAKLKRLAGIASMSAYLEKLIKDAK
jgi:hypothetical protein